MVNLASWIYSYWNLISMSVHGQTKWTADCKIWNQKTKGSHVWKWQVNVQFLQLTHWMPFVCLTRMQPHLLTTPQLQKIDRRADRLAWGCEGGKAVASYGKKTKTESQCMTKCDSWYPDSINQPPIQCVRTSILASFASPVGKKNISTSKLVKSQGILFWPATRFGKRFAGWQR